MSKKNPNPYDVVIIGGGPAGLSAALTLGRVRRKVIVVDSNEYRNSEAKQIHTVLTRDGTPPSEYRSIARHEIQSKYKTIEFLDNTTVTSGGKYQFEYGPEKGYQGFQIYGTIKPTDPNQIRGELREFVTKKVLIATGVMDVFPKIEGYKECWVKGIYHCLFCDGFDDADKHLGVLVLNASTPLAVHQAFSLSSNVTVFTNGPIHPKDLGVYTALQHRGAKINLQPIVRLIKEPTGADITVELADGNKITVGFMWHNKSKFTLRSKEFAKILDVDFTPMGLISTERQGIPMMQTSIRGIFAAGDCTEMLQQVATSVSGGVTAGGMMNFQLCTEDEEEDKMAVIAERNRWPRA